MPIHIRELIITATVDDQKVTGMQSTAGAAAKSDDAASKEELIQLCVDEVLRVLKQQTRR